jgi:hypothetical protein
MRHITDPYASIACVLIVVVGLLFAAYEIGQQHPNKSPGIIIPPEIKRGVVVDLDKWECTMKRLNGQCIEISIIDYPCIDVRNRKCVVEK